MGDILLPILDMYQNEFVGISAGICWGAIGFGKAGLKLQETSF